jgi:electron transfer flavoprotein beta subunit
LKYYVELHKNDLVLLGKQSIDDDYNQTGQILAGLLKWPQATFISELKINENRLQIVREIDGGLQTVKTYIHYMNYIIKGEFILIYK